MRGHGNYELENYDQQYANEERRMFQYLDFEGAITTNPLHETASGSGSSTTVQRRLTDEELAATGNVFGGLDLSFSGGATTTNPLHETASGSDYSTTAGASPSAPENDVHDMSDADEDLRQRLDTVPLLADLPVPPLSLAEDASMVVVTQPPQSFANAFAPPHAPFVLPVKSDTQLSLMNRPSMTFVDTQWAPGMVVVVPARAFGEKYAEANPGKYYLGVIKELDKEDAMGRIWIVEYKGHESEPHPTDEAFFVKRCFGSNRHTAPWTHDEDDALIELVKVHGIGDLGCQKIAAILGSRTAGAVPSRWEVIRKQNGGLGPLIKKDKWTHDEEERLKRLVREYGGQELFGLKTDWKEISQLLGTGRTPAAVESHWKETSTYTPKPLPKKWTHVEEVRLKKLVKLCGDGPRDWKEISVLLGTGRTETAVKQHWQIITREMREQQTKKKEVKQPDKRTLNQNEDGTYGRPRGASPLHHQWDSKRGEWTPKPDGAKPKEVDHLAAVFAAPTMASEEPLTIEPDENGWLPTDPREVHHELKVRKATRTLMDAVARAKEKRPQKRPRSDLADDDVGSAGAGDLTSVLSDLREFLRSLDRDALDEVLKGLNDPAVNLSDEARRILKEAAETAPAPDLAAKHDDRAPPNLEQLFAAPGGFADSRMGQLIGELLAQQRTGAPVDALRKAAADEVVGGAPEKQHGYYTPARGAGTTDDGKTIYREFLSGSNSNEAHVDVVLLTAAALVCALKEVSADSVLSVLKGLNTASLIAVAALTCHVGKEASAQLRGDDCVRTVNKLVELALRNSSPDLARKTFAEESREAWHHGEVKVLISLLRSGASSMQIASFCRGPCRHCHAFFKMLGHVTVGDGDAIPACLVPAGATVKGSKAGVYTIA